MKKLRKILLGIIVMVMCAVGNVSAASDWKECNTKVVITNTTDQILTYHVIWLDHDIKELLGQPVPRCGGEARPGEVATMSSNFRLCPGRHAVLWYSRSGAEVPVRTLIKFILYPDSEQVVITPEKVFEKINHFYKPPKMEDI
jgi:hypothetical protein